MIDTVGVGGGVTVPVTLLDSDGVTLWDADVVVDVDSESDEDRGNERVRVIDDVGGGVTVEVLVYDKLRVWDFVGGGVLVGPGEIVLLREALLD